MYLTTQRVISPSDENGINGINGINGFLFEHGAAAGAPR